MNIFKNDEKRLRIVDDNKSMFGASPRSYGSSDRLRQTRIDRADSDAHLPRLLHDSCEYSTTHDFLWVITVQINFHGASSIYEAKIAAGVGANGGRAPSTDGTLTLT